MKKLLFLIVVICMSMHAFPASAQTSTSSFGITTFCQPLSKSGNSAREEGMSNAVFNKFLDMKSEKGIYSSLLKAGFICNSKRNVKEYSDQFDEWVTIFVAKYSKKVSGGKIIVNQKGCNVVITFPNMAEKNKFLQTVQAEKKKGYIYESDKYYWIGVDVDTKSNSLIVKVSMIHAA